MTYRRTVRGTVRGGVIVPQENTFLPEGTEVGIVLPSIAATPEDRAESDIWQQARRESDALRAKWDSEPKDANGWPQSFLKDTYGSCADDPIERLPQEPMSAELLAELAQWQALAAQTWEMFPYKEGNHE